MIRSHRARHLRLWITLALLLPALLISALLARPDRPEIERPIEGLEPLGAEAP